VYWTISFKSTGGVTRDPFYLFDISATAEFLCDTSKISAFEPKILCFLFIYLGNRVFAVEPSDQQVANFYQELPVLGG
jgi:hypothetical protein